MSALMLYGKKFELGQDFNNRIVMIAIIMEFVFIILVILLYVNRQKKEQLQLANIQKEEYLRLQEQQYRVWLDNEQNIRKMKHDMDSHLDCIRVLLEESKMEAAKDYIKQIIEQKNQKIHTIYCTGNDLMDMQLVELLANIKRQNVSIQCIGQLPKRIALEAFDMTTIFLNLFRNAADAVNNIELEKEAFIHIKFHMENGNLVCLVENTYSQEILRDKRGRIVTSKQTGKHGYGIKNIIETVEKYNGKIQIDMEYNIFKVKILLFNMEK